MGHSLEHHITAVFDAVGLRYASQFKTIKGKKPDYLFPDAESYSDLSFPTDRLTMLAAKSSCKDRWSQVLSEADRIPYKHLLTLDPGIPESTTEIMKRDKLQLVAPKDRFSVYTAAQKRWLMTFGEFISMVKDREHSD
jgi:hypothetical protein